MELEGKTALVTGGARRVGRKICQALSAAGANVVINYSSSAAEANQLCKLLESGGRRATTFRADVSDKSDVDALMRHTQEQFGRLDVVINNASLFESANVLDITPEAWDRVLAVNLKGPFLVAQAAAPMLREHRGNIINLVDLSAFQPWPSYAHHSVSKAGLAHLTKILARALAPDVRVNAIAPGTVMPPEGYDGIGSDGTTDRRVTETKGSPDDVIRAMFYLLESNFVTGQIVVVDGGRMLL